MLKIYGDTLSPPHRAVLLFVKAVGIDYELVNISLKDGEQNSDMFTKLTPMRKVPIVEDGGLILTESVAILQYLASMPEVPDHWYPADRKLRAKVNEVLVWNMATGFHSNGTVLGTLVAEPFLTGKPVDEAKLKQNMALLEKNLNLLENHFLRDGVDFLVGRSEISIADVSLYCNLLAEVACNYPIGGGGRQRVQRWFEAVGSRLEPHASEINAAVEEFAKPHRRDTF